MQTDLPFFDCAEDALRAAVQHLGGAKKVGPMLWPDRPADHAGRLLLDCLNPDRAEKLGISQVMMLLRAARDAGYHAPMQWVSSECGYDAHPITREDEVDRVTTTIAEASKVLSAGLATLERLQRSGIQSVRKAS